MPVNLDAGYENPWNLGDYEIDITADDYTIDYDYGDFDFTDGAWSPDYDSVFDEPDGGGMWDLGDYSVTDSYDDGGTVNLDAGGGSGGLLSRPETPAEKEEQSESKEEEDDFWDNILKTVSKSPALLTAIMGGAGAGLNYLGKSREQDALVKEKQADRDWQREKFEREMGFREMQANRTEPHDQRIASRNQSLAARGGRTTRRRTVRKA